jgi:hypothetical protein
MDKRKYIKYLNDAIKNIQIAKKNYYNKVYNLRLAIGDIDNAIDLAQGKYTYTGGTSYI